MGKIFQLRTKKKINKVIDEGFTFNVPSKRASCYEYPANDEIKKALEAIGGKEATKFCEYHKDRYEVLS